VPLALASGYWIVFMRFGGFAGAGLHIHLMQMIGWMMIALPGQLFYSTQIPACLWFLARNKNSGGKLRDRRGEVLFIDARKPRGAASG